LDAITTPSELDRAIRELLAAHGCTIVSPRHLAAEARAYREESLAYDPAADSMESEPFFHYVVAEEIAIFLIDGDPFLIYAFRCRPHELITYVENDLRHTDVDACKYYVATVLGKRADIAVSAELAYRWMAACPRERLTPRLNPRAGARASRGGVSYPPHC
jgi:hypothetical protein